MDPNPESAAADLRKAGYQIFMMPDEHPPLAHPRDYFIEVTIDGPDDHKIMDEVKQSLMAMEARAWNAV